MSVKLGYPIKAKKSGFFCKISPFEFGQEQKWPFSTSCKNEKNHVFTFRFSFAEIIVTKPKVNIHSNIHSFSELRTACFCSFSFPGPRYSLFSKCILALPQFSTSWLHCMQGNSQTFLTGSRSFLHFFIFMLLRPTTEISRLLWFSVVTSSKICRVKTSINSRVPRLLRFGAAIFPVSQATSQIRKRRTSPYSLLWESGLVATVTLNDAHQAATKDGLNGCKLTENRTKTLLEPLM